MTDHKPTESLVVSYLNEPHYHRGHAEDDLRPACHPERIRGILAIRLEMERQGQTACPECWPPQ